MDNVSFHDTMAPLPVPEGPPGCLWESGLLQQGRDPQAVHVTEAEAASSEGGLQAVWIMLAITTIC